MIKVGLKIKTCTNISDRRLYMVVWSLFVQQRCDFALSLNSSECSYVLSLWMKSRKKLAPEVIVTSATHASLVCDVTNSLQDTKMAAFTACIGDFQTSVFNESDHKSTKTLMWVFFCFFSISFHWTYDAFSLKVPCNLFLATCGCVCVCVCALISITNINSNKISDVFPGMCVCFSYDKMVVPFSQVDKIL